LLSQYKNRYYYLFTKEVVAVTEKNPDHFTLVSLDALFDVDQE
jgi:hypothetical protein